MIAFHKSPKHVASIKVYINVVATEGLNFHFSLHLSQRDVIPIVDVYKLSTTILNKSAIEFSEFRRAVK